MTTDKISNIERKSKGLRLFESIPGGTRFYGFKTPTSSGVQLAIFYHSKECGLTDVTFAVAAVTESRLGKRGVCVSGSGHNHLRTIMDVVEIATDKSFDAELVSTDYS